TAKRMPCLACSNLSPSAPLEGARWPIRIGSSGDFEVHEQSNRSKQSHRPFGAQVFMSTNYGTARCLAISGGKKFTAKSRSTQRPREVCNSRVSLRSSRLCGEDFSV